MTHSFVVEKMKHKLPSKGSLLQYTLGSLELKDAIGSHIRIESKPEKTCIACGREIKKTFQQGHCYPCFQTLAACDLCVMKPELCHYDKGTCREPSWGESHCLIDTYLYVANTSGIKVGLTRKTQELTRWGDQGAIQAVILAKLPQRKFAGQIEDALRGQVSERTNWRALIKGELEPVDILQERERIAELLPKKFQKYLVDFEEFSPVEISYPVNSYLEKAKTHNLDKEPLCEGVLNGIHGQYLLIGEKALNVRKYTGYQFDVRVG